MTEEFAVTFGFRADSLERAQVIIQAIADRENLLIISLGDADSDERDDIEEFYDGVGE